MLGFTLGSPVKETPEHPEKKLLRYFNPASDQQAEYFLSPELFYMGVHRADSSIWDRSENEEYILFLHGRLLPSISELDQLLSKKISLSSFILPWFEHGVTQAVCDRLNGDFCIVLIHKKNGLVQIITDRMGFLPVYILEVPSGVFLGTHPDALILLNPSSGKLDETSIAQYLFQGRIESPNTLWEEVKQVQPGSWITIQYGKTAESKSYWKPESKFDNTPKKLVEKLTKSIQEAGQRETHPYFGNHGLFLSGGADSRGILFSSKNIEKTATFFDKENAELETARLLAERAGVTHIGLQRDFEHYAKTADLFVHITQGMMSLDDNHFLSFLDRIEELKISNWHTGCFADWMFKGLPYNIEYQKLFSRNLPTWKKFSRFNFSFYTPASKISQTAMNRVLSRLKPVYGNFEASYLSEKDWWNVEIKRLWPINREMNFGSRMSLRAYLKWSPLFADNSLIELWQMIPPRHKLNGSIWKKAISNITRKADNIRDNNWGGYVGASVFSNSLLFLLRSAKRKVFFKKTTQGIESSGSWPNFPYFLEHSKELPRIWNNISTETHNYLKSYFEPEQDVKKDTILFFKYISIALWMDQQKIQH